jgi:hypothetical protein
MKSEIEKEIHLGSGTRKRDNFSTSRNAARVLQFGFNGARINSSQGRGIGDWISTGAE